MARKLTVEIVGDSRSLERAFARSSKSATKFQGSITGMGQSVRGVFGGLAVGVALKKTIDAASSLNEEITKSEQIFGSASEEILAWSETTTESFKLSQRAALEASGNFGAMFRTLGLGTTETAQMSRRLTELGADMASFNNQDPTEMLDRLRSGLAGEAEPLRRFGVLISEARVKQEAYRSGIARTGAKLTEQQKVQARYNLILRDTALAQGDVARTGENWAGVQRELSAAIEDTAAKIGRRLLPVLTDVIDKFNESEDWMERWSPTANEGARERIRKTLVKGFTDGLLAAVPDQTAIGKWAERHRKALQTELDAMDLVPPPVPDESALAATRAAVTARERAAGGDRAGGRRGTTAAERASRAAAAARRIAGVDARLARELNRLQDLGLRQQLAGLRAIAAQVRSRLAATKDITRRLTLEDQLLSIYREQRSVQEQIGDNIKVANQALKDRADAIKSAVIDRLQRRQTDILNKRALADAKEQLRIARQIGGPRGIREAQRGLQDVGFDIQRARIENAPATLTAGGRFALAGVVININGVTDPAEVARRVEAILKGKNRKKTPQTRGATAAA